MTDMASKESDDNNLNSLLPVLTRIADALERLAPPSPDLSVVLESAHCFIWQGNSQTLLPIPHFSSQSLDLLQGIDSAKQDLLENSRFFAKGLPANNALLWGARGTGKSSLIKSVHQYLVQSEGFASLCLIEIQRSDLGDLPHIIHILEQSDKKCILYCDDLSFEYEDSAYKSLKAILDGGLQGRPANILFYATSNRRHLMARSMIENEREAAIHSKEAVEEKVSLSDRFGLWIGFHNIDQPTFFAMLEGYCNHYQLNISTEELHRQAIEWSMTRGGRSGRIAWQFIQDLAARQDKTLS